MGAGMTAAGTREAHLGPAFDRGAWPPGKTRAIAAALEGAFGAAAWSQGGTGRIVTVMIAIDIVAGLLPWRLPRSQRTAASVWAEAMLYLAVPAVFAVIVAVRGQAWLATGGLVPVWLIAAAAVGGCLIWAGGMPLTALFSGAIAAMAPPVRPAHKAERVTSAVLAPAGEEFLFRGPVLAVPHAAALPLGLLAGTAFVARHHVPPGFSARTPPRALATQCAAAVLLLALTLGSHSLIPALIAHWINNAPSIALEAMRPTWKE
jgi:CAAX prenyl protease-like protein